MRRVVQIKGGEVLAGDPMDHKGYGLRTTLYFHCVNHSNDNVR